MREHLGGGERRDDERHRELAWRAEQVDGERTPPAIECNQHVISGHPRPSSGSMER